MRCFLANKILESKRDQDVLRIFLGDEYYIKYNSIKSLIKDPEYKDVYRIIKKDVEEVKDFINNFQSNRNKRLQSKESGAKKIYENSDWIVYYITDYNASKYYGKDTKWCISGNYEGHEESGQIEFDKYNSRSKIYFYINKHNRREKYAVLKDRITDRIISIYDSTDYDIGNNLEWSDVDLPYVKEVGLNTKNQEDLFNAIRSCDDDIEFVEEYVNEDTINASNSNGVTPLMCAVGMNYINVVDFLIKSGADINANNKKGETPLMIACEIDNLKMVKLLIKRGASVNKPMIDSQSGSYLVSSSEEVRNFLVDNGAV